MREYADKNALISEIRKTADLFIGEFENIAESDKDFRLDEIDRTPREIIAYQLGWMDLIRGWDRDESEGREVITPAPGYRWNQMGGLYQTFYDKYEGRSLEQLRREFSLAVDSLIDWLGRFSEHDLFNPGGRKWASSTPSNWPVWKWVHINTVAPFGSFRSKIRKWKKLRPSK